MSKHKYDCELAVDFLIRIYKNNTQAHNMGSKVTKKNVWISKKWTDTTGSQRA